MRTLPLKYKNITPKIDIFLQKENPPKVNIEFYGNIKNLKQINCFSNEGNKWRNSEIIFKNDEVLRIYLKNSLENEVE